MGHEVIEPMWTTKDVAQFLSLTEETVIDYIKHRGLPAKRVGRLYRFDKDEVYGWIKNHPASVAQQGYGDERELPRAVGE